MGLCLGMRASCVLFGSRHSLRRLIWTCLHRVLVNHGDLPMKIVCLDSSAVSWIHRMQIRRIHDVTLRLLKLEHVFVLFPCLLDQVSCPKYVFGVDKLRLVFANSISCSQITLSFHKWCLVLKFCVSCSKLASRVYKKLLMFTVWWTSSMYSSQLTIAWTFWNKYV